MGGGFVKHMLAADPTVGTALPSAGPGEVLLGVIPFCGSPIPGSIPGKDWNTLIKQQLTPLSSSASL